MSSFNDLKPGGSGILPEETHPKFLARHLSAYHFVLPYVSGKDVLEIGFGDGYGSDFLASRVKSIKAVDVLERNVQLASDKYKTSNLEFMQMDATELSFDKGLFDIVVSLQVVEHVPENRLDKYMEGIRKVLKKGGIAFISTLNLETNKKSNRPYNKNPFHIKEFTYEEFDLLIKRTFSEHEIHGLFYTPALTFYERLKKIGFSVGRFYNNITVSDFVWKRKRLHKCIDFMAVCQKA